MRISRRHALRSAAAAALATTAVGIPVAGLLNRASARSAPARMVGDRTYASLPAGFVSRENQHPGSQAWKLGADGTRPADDIQSQVKGFASATTVEPGESLSFFVTVARSEAYTIDIYRLGWYGGAGARHMSSSASLDGGPQRPYDLDPATGLITCDWEPAWTRTVPEQWPPGAYIAVFTTASGWRNYTPFVVHSRQVTGGLCVVLPFTTYQAYNQWPLDGAAGKSLYYGYAQEGSDISDGSAAAAAGDSPAAATGPPPSAPARRRLDSGTRALRVSFDRPYMKTGLPNRFDDDHYFIQWVERNGYDVNYATSIDLESGRLEPARHAGLIFCGHDEYWSLQMRDRVSAAHAHGCHLAFMGANNIYWHIRFAASARGVPNRVVVCHKHAPANADLAGMGTRRWRDPWPGPADPEQRLLGVQYNGIVKDAVPLVVQRDDHWFWEGTGVQNGTEIDSVVAGEADGYSPLYPSPAVGEQVLLSSSPYVLRSGGSAVQNTGLHTADDGALVFVAGTLNWTKALAAPTFRDPRIERATDNLLARMLR